MPEKRRRTSIPESIKAQILFQNDHSCCICHKSPKVGIRVQIHHINENPSDNSLDNLAVLCRDCHDRLKDKLWMGQGFYQDEVKKYKRLWEIKVSQNRERLPSQQPNLGELLKSAENAYNNYFQFMREIAQTHRIIEQPPAALASKAKVQKEKPPAVTRTQPTEEEITHVLTKVEKAYKAYMDAERAVVNAYKDTRDQVDKAHKTAEHKACNAFEKSIAQASNVLDEARQRGPDSYQQAIDTYFETFEQAFTTLKDNLGKSWETRFEITQEAWRIYSTIYK